MSFNQAPGRARVGIQIPNGEMSYVYVRGEHVDATNEAGALDAAKPQEDETVMNSHQVP
jgi:hypothetical protein